MQFHTKWLHGEVKNDEWPGFEWALMIHLETGSAHITLTPLLGNQICIYVAS
jgi:hypothetical protein